VLVPGARRGLIYGPGVVRIRLTPQRREFFDLLASASSNAVDIARLLLELLERFPEGGAELVGRIKSHEHKGDAVTREVIGLLNRTFVTPFDRDDIYRLAQALDDICDFVDDAADHLDSYGVQAVPRHARDQADVILRAAVKLDEAVQRLDGFNDSTLQLQELQELEDEGDRLVRDGVAELFHSERDPIAVIRWKDIHERLEDAIDACENAADVLEAILVKNR
jgi:predicted phosphate transport protein (TIGR00153 family)